MNAPFPAFADARPKTSAGIGTPESRCWWQTRTVILMLVLLVSLPLVYPTIPPLVDLPGHLGRYRIELDLAHSPELQRHFTFNWSPIGNLGVDLLVIPASKFVGLELATKLIVACIPPLTILGFLATAREVHGRVPATALFAVPLAYNQAFQFGFVNFALGMALCFLAFALWLRLGRRGKFKLRTILFAPIVVALYFVHAFAWGSFCLLAISTELVRQWKGRAHWRTSLLRTLGTCFIVALPLLPLLAWRGHSTGLTFERWLDIPLKLTSLAGVFRDRWRLLDLGFAGILFVVLVEARSRPLMSFAPSLVAAAAALGTAFAILPWKLLGSAYADMRLAPYLLATALLAISFKDPGGEEERRWALRGAAFLGIFLLIRVISFVIAGEDQHRQFAALDRIPMHARVLTLAGRPCQGWALSRNAHYGSMAIVRRDGFSNDQWIVPGMNPLGLRHKNIGHFGGDPSQLVVSSECADEYFWSVDQSLAAIPPNSFDYLWLIDAEPGDPRLLGGFKKVWQSGRSSLYKLG